MKKSDYDRLLKAELEWIPNDYDCYRTFWINEFTHIVISKKPNGKYQILRSWIMNEPAISIDIENGSIDDVVGYIIRKLIDNQPVMKIEE